MRWCRDLPPVLKNYAAAAGRLQVEPLAVPHGDPGTPDPWTLFGALACIIVLAALCVPWFLGLLPR